MSIPLRDFGKTGVKISALGLGGHHLGDARTERPPSTSSTRPSTAASPSSTTLGVLRRQDRGLARPRHSRAGATRSSS